MTTISSSWTAGAHSIEVLQGDGWFTFSVPVGANGVSVGLVRSDESTADNEPAHGLLFASGLVRLRSHGWTLSTPVPYAETDVFGLARLGARVLFLRASAPGEWVRESVSGLHLPGHVIFDTPAQLQGPLLLDAALRYTGDAVLNASIGRVAGCTVALPTLQVAASENDLQGVSLQLARARVACGVGQGASLALQPLQAVASDAARAEAHLRLPAATVGASQGEAPLVGVSIRTRNVHTYSAGVNDAGAVVHARLRPGRVLAAEADTAGGDVALPTLRLQASGAPSGGVSFDVKLPRISGSLKRSSVWVLDRARATERLMTQSWVLVHDAALAQERMAATSVGGILVRDAAIATQRVAEVPLALLRDTALGREQVSAVVDTSLRDAALGRQQLTVQALGVLDVRDAGAARERTAVARSVDVLTTATASERLALGSTAAVHDTAWAGEQLLAWSNAAADVALRDAAAGTESLSSWSVGQLDVADSALADDALHMQQRALLAWVLNADTGAVAWYDNWGFVDMARVGGKVFAAGPDGLVLLGGPKDGVDDIAASVQWGYTEFGGYDDAGRPRPSEAKKRVPVVTLGYSAERPMRLGVRTYGAGQGEYHYALQPRAAMEPTNNRALLGKGLCARYWKFSVGNQGCGDFEVRSLSADVHLSTRRF